MPCHSPSRVVRCRFPFWIGMASMELELQAQVLDGRILCPSIKTLTDEGRVDDLIRIKEKKTVDRTSSYALYKKPYIKVMDVPWSAYLSAGAAFFTLFWRGKYSSFIPPQTRCGHIMNFCHSPRTCHTLYGSPNKQLAIFVQLDIYFPSHPTAPANDSRRASLFQ